MNRLSKFLLIPFAFLISGSVSYATTVFMANLSNGAENPPTTPTLVNGNPRPASFGTATFVLNDAMTQLTMMATIFNIDFTGSQSTDPNDNLMAAHIHAGPNTPPGNNPVVWGFFGTPFNDNNPNDVVITPFSTGVGGTISGKWDMSEGNNTTLTAQIPNILAGTAYINFHTMQFGGGEIRGNIFVVPEPATFGLLGSGVAAMFLLRRRRNRV